MNRPALPPRLLLLGAILLYVGFLYRYGVQYAAIDFVDLPTFHSAARGAFGEGLSPYTTSFLDAAGEAAGRHVFPFLYPPPSLLFFYPLSLLPYRTAAVLVLIVNHLCLAAVGLLLLRALGTGASRFSLLALVYLLLYHPVVVTLGTGQVNLIVLVLLCATWLLARSGSRPVLAGLPLAAAILLKLYPAILLPWLAMRRRAAAAGWTLGWCAVGTAAAVAGLPGGVWADWLQDVAPTGGYGQAPFRLFSPAAPFNQSLNAFVARLFLPNEFSEVLLPSPQAARALAWLLSAAVVLLAFGVVYRSSLLGAATERSDGARFDLEFAFLLAVMTLAAPLSWEHHLVFVLPAILLAVREASRPRIRPVPAAIVLGAAAVLAWRIPVWSKLFSENPWTLLISIKMYAVLALCGYLAVRLWRPSDRPA